MQKWLVSCLVLIPAVAVGQGAEPVAPPPAGVPPPAIAAPVAVPGAPPVALAATPPLDPTIHRHLGFFFRVDVGVGYLHSSTGARSVSGVGVPLGFAVGGAVTENLILAAEAWGTGAPGPSQTSGGTTSTTVGSTLALGAFGLNVTYYFMPANLYLSVTPAITSLGIIDYTGNVESTTGFGVKVALGKEWWVSDHWGLGLAVEFSFATNKQAGTNPPSWTTFGGGLVFSATYN
jgi:hypothetical protein